MLLDIENGSVAGALVRTSATHAPKLFGEQRIDLGVGTARTEHSLREKAGHAVQQVAEHLAQVAARLRGHPHTSDIGVVERATFFVSAPWGVPDLVAGTPSFSSAATSDLVRAIEGHFDIPTHFHTRASAALHGIRSLVPHEDTYLLCIPSGEVVEVLSVEQGSVRTYGTLPVGRHTLLRTLQSHGSLTEPEARSALRIRPAHAAEPLRAAYQHIAGEFTPAATELGWHNHERVYVLSHDGDWFARALAESPSSSLFKTGAVVKHITGAHLSPHISQHAHTPDLGLLSAALFVDTHYR